MLGALRVAAIVEAVTYLVLLAAVVEHRLLDGPDLVGPAGLVHGVVFLGYTAVVLRVAAERSWPRHVVVTLLFAAFVPLGTIVAERRYATDRRAATGR